MVDKNTGPDSTAVRVALWRALHVQADSAPYVLEDEVGLKLIGPKDDWRSRPDMNPDWTRGYRASIVGRARFIEDLVTENQKRGICQYVILGAGLDTFAQRRPEIASKLRIFEVDRPETQAWKKQRLIQLGFGIPNSLHLVPVDFEKGASWLEGIVSSGFDPAQPAIIVSTGVSMYLTQEANIATLEQIAKLAPGSILAMTFLLPLELIDPKEREQHQIVYEKAREAGTPFLSFFRPEEILSLAREAGFKNAEYVSTEDLTERYFAARTDGLRPSTGESFLIATC